MGRVLVGAVVVAALVAAGCTASGEHPRAVPPEGTASPQSTASPQGTASPAALRPAPIDRLRPWTWRLVRYALPGRRSVRVLGDATLTFGSVRGGGTSVSMTAGCRNRSGAAVVGPRSYAVHVKDTVTLEGCVGGFRSFASIVFDVAGAPTVRWRLDGDRLWVRTGRGTLVYLPSTPAYEDTPVLTLATGERGGWRYRFYGAPSAYGPKLGLALRDAAGEPVRTFRAGPPRRARPGARWPWHLSLFRVPVADAAFVGGFAPAGTARVVHRVSGASPAVELRLRDVGGVPWPAYGGLVAAHHDEGSTVTAYGQDGRVLGGWAGWQL